MVPVYKTNLTLFSAPFCAVSSGEGLAQRAIMAFAFPQLPSQAERSVQNKLKRGTH